MTDLLQRRKTLHHQVDAADKKLKQLEASLVALQPLANLGLAWAMTAHELNNMLMPVLNYARLAMQNPDDQPLCEKALQKSLNAAERIAEMMEKIMALAGGGKTDIQPHNLGQIFDDVFTCIGRDFEKDRIRVERTMAPDIEIRADIVTIRQAFMNLLLNARHAMLEKGGRLTISADQTADGTHIRITDTGCGIDPQRLKNIFTPFYTAGKENGNGLGLAFCRTVIEAHGGYIQAESVPGKGTTFKILLPKHAI